MERIDFEIDDFMNNCDYKNLSRKTMKSYEQSLRLFVKYLNDRDEEEKRSPITKTEQIKEKDIKDYITNTKERGKYTVLIDESTRKTNNPTNRGDFGKKVSIATINNYTRWR